MSECSLDGCTNNIHAGGLCQKHYRQAKRRERGLGKRGPAPDASKPFSRYNPEGNKVAKGTRHKNVEGGVCMRGHLLEGRNMRVAGGRISCRVCSQNRRRAQKGLDPLDTVVDGRTQRTGATHCGSGHELTPDNTYLHTTSKGYVNRHCKKCARARRYGITYDELEQMLIDQDGSCAICLSPFDAEKRGLGFHVDHCHVSGAVRGLLCSNCNTAIGLLGDDPATLDRALQYVKV